MKSILSLNYVHFYLNHFIPFLFSTLNWISHMYHLNYFFLFIKKNIFYYKKYIILTVKYVSAIKFCPMWLNPLKTNKMIHFLMVVGKQGKPRIGRFFTHQKEHISTQTAVIKLCLRDGKQVSHCLGVCTCSGGKSKLHNMRICHKSVCWYFSFINNICGHQF